MNGGCFMAEPYYEIMPRDAAGDQSIVCDAQQPP